MSDTLILDAVKAFLKPIIAEALHEAGNTTDTDTTSTHVARPPIATIPQPEGAAAIGDYETQPQTLDELTPEERAEAERREMMSKYYTVEDVKAILHIGTTSVYNLFKRRKLTKLKVLGKTVVARSELDNAVETQEIARYSHKR